MADFAKAAGQDVHKETADKLHGVQGHRFRLILMGVIPPEKSDLAVLQGQNAVIGDGNAMGITSQISNYFFSGAKRRLAVYDPLFAAANVQEFLVCIRKFLFEKGQEFAPEFSGKHPNGQEEFLF